MEKGDETANLMIENSVALQKVLTNLTEKLDKLCRQISSLMNLFETAATSFKAGGKAGEGDELILKLDKVTEQNQTIAKALMLLGEKFKGKQESAF